MKRKLKGAKEKSEALENAKNNDASASELIKIYRKAVAEAEAADSPETNLQVITTSSTMVEQTLVARQSSLVGEEIRESSSSIRKQTVSQSHTDTR